MYSWCELLLQCFTSVFKVFKKFKVVGIAGKKKRKKIISKDIYYYTSWKKMIDELQPSLVVIGVPPLEQEKILEFLLKKK